MRRPTLPGWRVVMGAIVLAFAVSSMGSAQSKDSRPAPRDFTEQDALHTLQRIGDAFETNNEGRFLVAFDPDRMADYPVFRDRVHALFQQYESFEVSYQVQQVAMEAANGVALADFTLDARPVGGELPDVRKTVQLRLVLAWTGKEWKIVAFSPTDLFSS